MTSAARFGIAVALLLSSASAAYVAARLAKAERLARLDTIPALRAASRLAPSNADYRGRLAMLDASRDDDLSAALRLDPWRAPWWILRAVREEEDGDLAAAEQSLLRANRVSHDYTPRWSLAAFYYRRHDAQAFAPAARAALSVGYGAPEPFFRMAQRLGFDPERIVAALLPADPRPVSSYLALALQDRDLAAAELAARKLLAIGSADDAGPVLNASGALFRAARIPAAVDLWNRLVRARWIQSSELDPARGLSLANPAFRPDSPGRAFEWQLASILGVERAIGPDGALRLEFSGNQPEQCDLAAQSVALQPASRYRLTIAYALDGIPAASGLRVSLQPLSGGPPLASAVLEDGPGEDRRQSVDFQSPPAPAPFRLVIGYARASGTTRIEGRFSVRSVHLDLVP